MEYRQSVALSHVLEFVHDKKWMTARLLALIHKETNINKEYLAVGFSVFVSAYLCVGPNARFICNMLLTLVPMLVTFVFPKERSASRKLFVYWAVFGITTTLDEGLEKVIPVYYFFKMILHILLFLRPFCYADQIVLWLEEVNVVMRDETEKGRKKKPRSQSTLTPIQPSIKKETKTDSEEWRFGNTGNFLVNVNHGEQSDDGSKDKIEAIKEQKASSAETAVTLREIAHPMLKEENKEATSTSKTEMGIEATPSRADVDARANVVRPPNETNPMLVDPQYRLTTDSNTSIDNNGNTHQPYRSPVAHLHDFQTWPLDCVVFNAPFDSAITYHMRIKNNSKHKIAYVVKGNCLDRVTVYPPSGVLASGVSILLGVKCQAFNPESINAGKDRFVFEYAFCSDETKEFSFKLLQTTEFKRRKNIYIKYNI